MSLLPPAAPSEPGPVSPRSARSARPHVLINMAMTADGKIATASRAVSSFGSPQDQRHLYELRATADAVMAGARTVDLNPIQMGPGGAQFRKLRQERGLEEYNLRVIVTGSGSIDPGAEIFRHRFSPILVLTSGRAPAARLKRLRGLADDVLVCGEAEVDLSRAMQWLRRTWQVRRLLCEGGGELNAALFEAGLVDELHLTICPRIIGGRAAPTVAEGAGIPSLRLARQLELTSCRRVGDELFLVYRTAHRKSSPPFPANLSSNKRRPISIQPAPKAQ